MRLPRFLQGVLPLRTQIVPIASIMAATAANNFLTFAINVLAAKNLGVEGFGIFSLAFSLATLLGVFGDLGFNLSMVRLFNKYQADPEKQTYVLGSALGFKVLLLIAVATVSFPLGGVLARHMGLDPGAQGLFAIALFTGGLLFIWTYFQSYLQAHRLFRHLAAYILAYMGLRLLFLLVAYRFSSENPMAWLMATYTVPLVVLAAVGVALKGWGAIMVAVGRPGASFPILKELLGYGKWVAISAIAYTAMPYVVRFILAIRGSLEEVGIFSAGMTFAVAFSTLNTAIRAVLFPQVTAFQEEQMRAYLARLNRIAPYYAVFVVFGVAGLGLMQWLLLGGEYRTALPVFLVTSVALAGVIFLGFRTMILHTLMRPEVDAYVNVIRLALTALLAYALVPEFRAPGAAVAYGLPLLIGEGYMSWYVARRVNNG